MRKRTEMQMLAIRKATENLLDLQRLLMDVNEMLLANKLATVRMALEIEAQK